MRTALLVAGLLLVSSCDYFGDHERTAPLAPPEFVPIEVGTCGSYQEATCRMCFDMDSQGAGRKSRGEPRGRFFPLRTWVDVEAYCEFLQPIVEKNTVAQDRVDQDHVDGLPIRDFGVRLAIDARAPWRTTRHLLLAFADRRVRIHRVFFEVALPGRRESGTLAAFLPLVLLPRELWWVRPSGNPLLHLPDDGLLVTLSESRGARFRSGTLYRAAEIQAPAKKARLAVIEASDRIPTGLVVEAFDLLLRAGYRQVVFSGAAPEWSIEDPEILVSAERSASKMLIDGEFPNLSPARDPPSGTGWEDRLVGVGERPVVTHPDRKKPR